jgi:hypothetical protein
LDVLWPLAIFADRGATIKSAAMNNKAIGVLGNVTREQSHISNTSFETREYNTEPHASTTRLIVAAPRVF